MDKELRVLILEDTPTDAELVEHELRKAGIVFVSKRVDRREAFIRALDDFRPDIVLSDYHLPDFDGMAALNIMQNTHPEVPVIMVTGALSDIEAVDLIHAGARDYVLKDRLARLSPAVQRALSVEQGVRARKAAEKALHESLVRYTNVTEGANDAIVSLRPDGSIELWNKMAEQMFGYSRDEAVGQQFHDLIAPARYRSEAVAGMQQFRETGTGAVVNKTFEITAIRRDGSEFPVEVSISAMNLDNAWHATGIIRDITERKQTEEGLLRLNRTLRALSAGNHALVHGENETSLLESMCQAVTEGGYIMAWVGYAMQDEKKSVMPMAMSGKGRTYVEMLDITWGDQPLGRGPTGTAVRTGQTQIVRDIGNDPCMAPWREAAANYGFASSIALPLKEDGAVIGTLTIYAAELDAFSADQVTLLEEMADDLAFGIVTLRTRSERDQAIKERQHYVERLRASLEDALQAIAATVEMRDPYTAGHQRRVAELAVAIAREMGLAEEQTHGIRLAGIVHDLGKVHIPAEILSKPGRLNELEYSFIKTHPQAGYDILKGIEFPWPIALTVLQHHERLDGSGYPQGLQGEAIIPEARILSVADVVEAMASHRPYRPSLGAEAALGEITKGRGVYFDAEVVDACIRLLREKNFNLGGEL